MRQVALCVVLAQAGSFVPADEASLSVVDRLFTRVGASDDIAGGESTFMREMAELTDILHDATEASLVLLDEVGRGTSTADGRAIARAAVEFLHDEVGATTLFATHYHDLTDLAADLPRVSNLHVRVAHEDDAEGAGPGVTFVHRVAEGAASASYGVEVARLAGVPDPVVERARSLVAADAPGREAGPTPPGATADEGDPTNGEHAPAGTEHAPAGTGSAPAGTEHAPAGTGSASDATTDAADGGPTPPGVDPAEAVAVARRLCDLDLATTTPLEALTRLHELQRRLDG
jgi:DNA mismatch repair protein MutS